MLEVNPEGVCATTFLRDHIPRYSARISELRQTLAISRVRCPYEHHSHSTVQYAWKLDTDDQGSMF